MGILQRLKVQAYTALFMTLAVLVQGQVSASKYGKDFMETKAKAEAGDAAAQVKLAQMYDAGKGVEESQVEGFKWWLKAAEQGVAVAQHNVGVAYLAGIGVGRSKAEAIKWFTRAADQGNAKAKLYAEGLKKGDSAAPLVIARARPNAAPNRHARPVRYGKKEEICWEVVDQFVTSHKYVPDHFVCVEFASGVWYELMQKGILAKIRVGGKDAASIAKADHAWVMAEVARGTWLAIEPQAGVIYPEKDSKYYRGYDFSNDIEVRQHNRLVHAYWEAMKEHQDATKSRDEVLKEYNNGGWLTRRNLQPHLDAREFYVNLKLSEVKKVEGDITKLLERATPSQ